MINIYSSKYQESKVSLSEPEDDHIYYFRNHSDAQLCNRAELIQLETERN